MAHGKLYVMYQDVWFPPCIQPRSRQNLACQNSQIPCLSLLYNACRRTSMVVWLAVKELESSYHNMDI